ncbi:MAG: sigma-70 family RNA polymerase sigma factor [Candidatus Limivivens sp.]|nr:sigma-70 family RNA polymerase sigma factor [Candidatus Limivivens sp.]
MKDLIRRALKKDGDAFVELMELHKQSMYKVAKSYLRREEDAADAIAETILDCFEHLDSLKEPAYFTTWLIRILINNCKDLLKKSEIMSCMEDTGFLEDRAAAGDDREFVRLLEPLDEETRLIMTLYYASGFTTKEIGSMLELKESTVKSRIRRGKQKLKAEFFSSIA